MKGNQVYLGMNELELRSGEWKKTFPDLVEGYAWSRVSPEVGCN